MSSKNFLKLHDIFLLTNEEKKMVVHAYYHMLRWERGTRFAKGGVMLYGENEFSKYWEQYAMENLIAYNMQLDEIPHWQDYLTERAMLNIERRMEKMFRTVDEDRPSTRKAEQAAKRARRKLNARYN